jgi:hypothetical protein
MTVHYQNLTTKVKIILRENYPDYLLPKEILALLGDDEFFTIYSSTGKLKPTTRSVTNSLTHLYRSYGGDLDKRKRGKFWEYGFKNTHNLTESLSAIKSILKQSRKPLSIIDIAEKLPDNFIKPNSDSIMNIIWILEKEDNLQRIEIKNCFSFRYHFPEKSNQVKE